MRGLAPHGLTEALGTRRTTGKFDGFTLAEILEFAPASAKWFAWASRAVRGDEGDAAAIVLEHNLFEDDS